MARKPNRKELHALEAADDVAYSAWDASGASRLAVAEKSLALSPVCADADMLPRSFAPPIHPTKDRGPLEADTGRWAPRWGPMTRGDTAQYLVCDEAKGQRRAGGGSSREIRSLVSLAEPDADGIRVCRAQGWCGGCPPNKPKPEFQRRSA